jgi:RNA polymerase sigma factor (sigma-70 family)
MAEVTTNWTVVERAGRGDQEARETFARVYLPIVRRYICARWGGTPWQSEIEDATNQVFVECLKPGGALSHVSREDAWGFRSYLFGVTRNVARSFERRRRHDGDEVHLDPPVADDSGLQQAFDRSFVEALLAEALERHQLSAEDEGEAASRRFELLRLRFWEHRPIREIAGIWGVEAARLHHDYARARVEFQEALRAVIADHCGAHAAVTESELANLLSKD